MLHRVEWFDVVGCAVGSLARFVVLLLSVVWWSLCVRLARSSGRYSSLENGQQFVYEMGAREFVSFYSCCVQY